MPSERIAIVKPATLVEPVSRMRAPSRRQGAAAMVKSVSAAMTDWSRFWKCMFEKRSLGDKCHRNRAEIVGKECAKKSILLFPLERGL